MARTVLPIAGAVVGAFFGNPQLGYAIGSVIGNAVDPQRFKGPRIGDVNLQTSQEGAPRAIVYGTAAVMGNLIDRGPLNKVITEERQGKGGGPVVENESLFMTFAIRICEGPIDGVSRIWEDERLVYDVRPESTILEDSLKYGQGFTLYLGSEDQLPDPDLEVIHGIGNTPAHRGTAYIVFTEKNLTDRRGTIPQFRFEVNGCTDVPFTESGDWVAFGPGYAVISSDIEEWGGAQIPVDTGWTGGGSGFIDGVLYVGTDALGENFQRSTDRGLTYSAILFPSSPNPDSNRRIDKFGARLFIGTPSAGTLYSSDGVSWTLSSAPGETTPAKATHSRWESNGEIYGINTFSQLVWKSTDGGVTWAYVQSGGSNVLIGRVCSTIIKATGALVAFASSPGFRNIVRLSTNNALSWSGDVTLPSGADSLFFPRCVEVSGARVVAANTAGQIVYSSDSGASWEISSYTFPATPNFMLFADGKWLLVGDGGAMAYSESGGVNWTSIDSGSFGTDNITSIAFMGRRVYG